MGGEWSSGGSQSQGSQAKQTSVWGLFEVNNPLEELLLLRDMGPGRLEHDCNCEPEALAWSQLESGFTHGDPGHTGIKSTG